MLLRAYLTFELEVDTVEGVQAFERQSQAIAASIAQAGYSDVRLSAVTAARRRPRPLDGVMIYRDGESVEGALTATLIQPKPADAAPAKSRRGAARTAAAAKRASGQRNPKRGAAAKKVKPAQKRATRRR